MAQVKPLLSLCIPIYNRLYYLDKQLSRFLEDKELFDEQIQLIISDNCSEDDLQSCCEKYQSAGLKLLYNRNSTNLESDGNFDWCFHHADGKYVWLLGSDDIPQKGFLREIISILKKGDYGLIHILMKPNEKRLVEYSNQEDLLSVVNYWITFVSASIIRTETAKSFNMRPYYGTFIIQVPVFLNACLNSSNNAIYYYEHPFEDGNDASNNGGYNLFGVFVTNLYGIYEEFIGKGLLSKQAFDKMIKIEYKEFLVRYIIQVLILGKKGNFKTENSWSALRKYYAKKPYAYYYLLKELVRRCLVGLLKPIINHFR